MTLTPSPVDLTKTSLHILELIGESEQHFLEQAVRAESESRKAVADQPGVPHAQLSLASVAPKSLLRGWWVELQEDGGPIIGTAILTPHGKTSEVIGYDPRSRRILTKSLSVYELGLPQTTFAAHGRQFLRQIGW
jgi:hypothetical protein